MVVPWYITNDTSRQREVLTKTIETQKLKSLLYEAECVSEALAKKGGGIIATMAGVGVPPTNDVLEPQKFIP